MPEIDPTNSHLKPEEIVQEALTQVRKSQNRFFTEQFSTRLNAALTQQLTISGSYFWRIELVEACMNWIKTPTDNKPLSETSLVKTFLEFKPFTPQGAMSAERFLYPRIRSLVTPTLASITSIEDPMERSPEWWNNLILWPERFLDKYHQELVLV